MQSNRLFRQDRIHLKHYLLLLLLCILAYWPLSFGIFSVKNDAIHYFLPYRFHISEALRNGEWPLWSPYLYNGNPIMGDMQSGAWNPVVWIFSLFGRYDLTLFHIENLLYIFIGGVGMYKLSFRLSEHGNTALLTACTYMLSGFMLGGQLINWLAAAAFLPFVLHYYLLSLRHRSMMSAVKTGGALYLLFTAGYPSFFILTGYLLFILFIITLIAAERTGRKPVLQLLPAQLVILLVFAGLSLPAILAYADLLPFYERGTGTSYAMAASNAFDPQHFLTMLYPASIRANDIVSGTDVTCRNIYTGLLPLLLLVAVPPRMNRRNVLLLLLALFSILFSMGSATPVREWCYQLVPLMDTFRHPSQMRLFFILALLLLALPGIKKILSAGLVPAETKRLKWVLWGCTGIALASLIIAFPASAIFSKLQQQGAGGISSLIKKIIETVTLADTIVLSSLIQLFFLGLALARFSKFLKSFTWIIAWQVVNLFLMAQLVLPASFVSQVSPKEINAVIHASPAGFPGEGLQYTLAVNSKDAFAKFAVSGLDYFYTKKPGISKVTNSPAFLSQTDRFIQTMRLYDYVASQPVVYLADSLLAMKDTSLLPATNKCRYAFTEKNPGSSACTETDRATVIKLSALQWQIRTNTADSSLLVLTQNAYPHWQVTVDGIHTTPIITNLSFMGVPVPGGTHTVEFRFNPVWIKRAIIIQLVFIVLLLGVCILYHFKRTANKP